MTTLPRRRLLAAAGCAGALALLGGCAALAAVPAPVRAGRIRLSLRNHPRLAEPGGSLLVAPEGRTERVLVLADGGGGYTALSPVCTHLGCTVDVAGANLVCPCHGSTYDRSGAVLRGPAERALASFPVRVGDGVLEIVLEERP